MKLNFEKDKAILEQKIEFLELELMETKLKIGETNCVQEAFLKAIELNNDLSKAKIPEEKIKNDIIEESKSNNKRLLSENDLLKRKIQQYTVEIQELNGFSFFFKIIN